MDIFDKKPKRLDDLPKEISEKLKEERLLLHKKWWENNSYHVSFTNKEGTRYFVANRHQRCWNDDKGHYMNFGGGSEWNIHYGKILWTKESNRTPIGTLEDKYKWVRSNNNRFGKSANGTEIPSFVKTKAEVLAIARKIGTLVMENPNKRELDNELSSKKGMKR